MASGEGIGRDAALHPGIPLVRRNLATRAPAGLRGPQLAQRRDAQLVQRGARRCRLWFFHPDPEEREPGHDVRYVLVREGEDGEWEQVLAQTDEWEAVIAALPDLPPS